MIDEYVEYLYGNGLAPGTIRMYRARLGQAVRWAADNGVDLEAPTAVQLGELRAEFVESASTLRQVRCALTHYWEWLGVRQPPVKALRVPHKPRPVWRGIPDFQARTLAHTAHGWHPEGTAVLVGLYMGLRRSEIAAMRWDRFSPDLARYTVTGKGGVTETIPVHSQLRAVLRPLRGGYVWLFPGDRRQHVSPATVWHWVGVVADEAGITTSTHQLRHTAINRVWKVTRDIRAAQRLARHARIDTTEVYLEYSVDDLAELVEEAFDWLNDDPSGAALAA